MSWRRRILWALMALGVLAGLPQIARRVRVESSSRNVDFVADQPSFLDLAQAYGIPPVTLLRRLKAAGVGALGVPEDSLASLAGQGRLTVLSTADWESVTAPGGPLRAGALVPGSLAAFLVPHAPRVPAPANHLPPDLGGSAAPPASGTYVLVNDGTLAAWLVPHLRVAVGSEAPIRTFSWNGHAGIFIAQSAGAVAGLPLGFAPGAFALARAAGMRAVPRPEAGPGGLGTDAVVQLYGDIAAAKVPVEAVVFAGAPTAPLPGYPAAQAATTAAFQRYGWLLGLIETPQQLGNVNQPGTEPLAAALGQRVARVYSVPPWILADPPSGFADAVFSQVTDFNIRMVYLRPLAAAPYPIAATLRAVRLTAQQLSADGYAVGRQPTAFAVIAPGRIQRVVQGLAVVAAALLLLELLVPPIARYGYQPLVVVGAVAALLCYGSGHISTLLVAFGAGIAFGGLGMTDFASAYHRVRWPSRPRFFETWLRSVSMTLRMAGITFAGALIIASVMGGTAFFLEWQYFRGVKLTFVASPLLATAAFLAWIGTGAVPARRRAGGFPLWNELVAVFEQPVRVKYIAAALLVGAIGAIYLIRSGNAPAAFVPSFEIHLRNLLQQVFTYRPREKDFLVGYPAAVVAAFFAARRQRWAFLFFLVGASVGQVALVDSFGTLRTPFMHSVLREGWGLILGVVLGSLVMALLQWAWAAGTTQAQGTRAPQTDGSAASPV